MPCENVVSLSQLDNKLHERQRKKGQGKHFFYIVINLKNIASLKIFWLLSFLSPYSLAPFFPLFKKKKNLLRIFYTAGYVQGMGQVILYFISNSDYT